MSAAIAAGLATAGAAVYSASKAGKGGSATQTNEPWKEQKPYLTYGFGQAREGYDRALAEGTYDGQRVADLNPFTTNGANFAGGYAQNYGQPGAEQLGTYGQRLLGQGSGFGANANDIYGRSTVDPTQGIIDNAGRYANNPWVDGVIDSANRDVVRGLNERDLPSLARAASGTGNTNSSRTGAESAILQRGAADRMADTSSNIRSQFFGKGLDMAQNQWNQNLTNQINANNGVGNAFSYGSDSIINGQRVAGNVFDAGRAAGGTFSGYEQALLDAGRAAYGENRMDQLDLAGKYSDLVNGNYGGTQTSTTPGQSPNYVNAALGGALGGYDIYNRFKTPAAVQNTPQQSFRSSEILSQNNGY